MIPGIEKLGLFGGYYGRVSPGGSAALGRVHECGCEWGVGGWLQQPWAHRRVMGFPCCSSYDLSSVNHCLFLLEDKYIISTTLACRTLGSGGDSLLGDALEEAHDVGMTLLAG